MKISSYTCYNENEDLLLQPKLLNKNIRNRRHSIFVRESINDDTKYQVIVTNIRTSKEEYNRPKLKPKTVLGVFKNFNVRIPN